MFCISTLLMRLITRLFLISFLILFAYSGFSQYSSFRNFDVNDGLPSSQVYDIIQDDFGFLWFSTDRGLSRYDGYSFENFGVTDGIPGSVVFDFYKAKNGKIWCTSSNDKLFSIQGREPVFEIFPFSETIQKYSYGSVVNNLVVEGSDQVNIQFRGLLGLLSISKKGDVVNKPHYHKVLSQSFNYSVFVSTFDNSNLFYADKEKIHKSDLNVGEITFEYDLGYGFKFESACSSDHQLAIYSYANQLHIYNKGVVSSELKEHDIIALGFLNDNRYWIGYLNGGCELYAANGNLLRKYQPSNSVTQLFQDDQGNLWLSTLDEGVFLYNSTKVGTVEKAGSRNYVSISKNKSGGQVIGDSYGSIFQKEGWNLKLINKPQRAHPAFLVYDSIRKKNYSISDGVKIGDQYLDKPLSSNFIEILNDKYLAVGINQLYLYDLDAGRRVLLLHRNKRLNDIIFCFSKYYIASEIGLFSMGNFFEDKTEEVLTNYNIRVLQRYNEYLLAGTKGRGLLFIDSTENIYKTIDKSSGLSSNYINNIIVDGENNIWLCTSGGINIISFEENGDTNIESIGITDGLLSNEINDILFLADTAWVATSKGMNFISRTKLRKKESVDNLYLAWDDIKVNEISVINQHLFNIKENNFEFGFKGIFLRGGDRIKYRYKLKGGGSDRWINLNSRSLYLSSLEPGNYKLHIQATTTSFTDHNEEISYKFTVNPPYWKTWWFLSALTLLILFLIYLFFRFNILAYNKEILREILRSFLKRIRKNEIQIKIRHQGNDVLLKTQDIGFIKTDGNYLEIHTQQKKYMVRSSLAKMMKEIPDRIEFLQVHRSYIVRIDQVSEFGAKSLSVFDEEIPIGRKYASRIKEVKASLIENR